MRNQNTQTNPFDDFDLWDAPAGSGQSQPFSQGKPPQREDLTDFYSFGDAPPRRTASKGRSGLPLWAGIVILALVVGGVLLLWPRSGSQPSPDNTTLRPVPTEAGSFPQDRIPVLTLPPTEPVTEPVTEPAPQPSVQQADRYFRSRLSPQEQAVYDILEAGIAAGQTTIGPVNVESKEQLKAIVHAVHFDNPRYFWFRGGYGSSYYDRTDHLEFTVLPEYAYPTGEIASRDAFFRSAAQSVIDSLKGKSDYEKVLGVYEYLVDHTVYDLAYTGKTPYELFADGRAVCEGYARTAQYLLTELGVQTLYVVGDAGELGKESQWRSHAWNIVRIHGEYYQMDPTWGDPVRPDGVQVKSFNYLTLTDREMARRHRAKNPQDYPVCNATTWNYHVLQGKYLTSFHKGTIEAWFYETIPQGLTLEFKAADEEIYRQAVNWLITEDGSHQLYRTIEPYAGYNYQYDCHDDTLVISITIYPGS